MPAASARSSTGPNAASDSAMVMFTFARAKPSDAAVKTAIASAPAASARSSPRRLGTSTAGPNPMRSVRVAASASTTHTSLYKEGES